MKWKTEFIGCISLKHLFKTKNVIRFLKSNMGKCFSSLKDIHISILAQLLFEASFFERCWSYRSFRSLSCAERELATNFSWLNGCFTWVICFKSNLFLRFGIISLTRHIFGTTSSIPHLSRQKRNTWWVDANV